MRLYFTSSQIPEMAKLSIPQRRFVHERCLFWLFRRVPYQAGLFAVTAVVLLFSAFVKWTQSAWARAALAGVGWLVLSTLYNMAWMAYWRTEVRRFIELHAEELEATT